MALARAEVTPSLSPPPPVPSDRFLSSGGFGFFSSFSRPFFSFWNFPLFLRGVKRFPQPLEPSVFFISVCVTAFLRRLSTSPHPPTHHPSLSCLPRERALLTMRATGTGTAGTAAASSGKAPPADGDERFSVLSWEQVQRLDHILEEAVPIHGRGNFPTLSVRPRRIVQVREGTPRPTRRTRPAAARFGDPGWGGGGGFTSGMQPAFSGVTG